MGNEMSIRVDIETGYKAELKVGHDYGVDVRCDRCGGRGACRYPPHDGEHVLCLRCADEWARSDILHKHMPGGLVKKQWEAAYREFLTTFRKGV